VSEREDKLFLDEIDNLLEQNREVDNDDDDSEEEDTGMGDVDHSNSGVSAY
jgi:translation initiation factor 2 subunit 1